MISLRDAIYNKYILPLKRKPKDHIGVEFEFPIVNLKKKAVDFKLCFYMTECFIKKFGFDEFYRDNQGYIYLAIDPQSGDALSFDCSYNTLELSFGADSDIHKIEERFLKYYNFIQGVLSNGNHTLTGMGVNPYHRYNKSEPISIGRYETLFHYLKSYNRYGNAKFPNYTDFGFYACASQVQLDVSIENVCDVLNTFTKLEPFKSVLFANSLTEENDKYLLNRDNYWRYSSHGINQNNVHMYENDFHTIEDILDYFEHTSIFCTEREGKYLCFAPIEVKSYFICESVAGEYYEHGTYHSYTFKPELSDLKYLRTYKLNDLTYRGTVEFRSTCMQPVSELFAAPAFHAGLLLKYKELDQLLSQSVFKDADQIQLRDLLNKKTWPKNINLRQLSQVLIDIVKLAKEGLIDRGFHEEHYLDPLYVRARALISPAREIEEGLKLGKTVEDYIYNYS